MSIQIVAEVTGFTEAEISEQSRAEGGNKVIIRKDAALSAGSKIGYCLVVPQFCVEDRLCNLYLLQFTNLFSHFHEYMKIYIPFIRGNVVTCF